MKILYHIPSLYSIYAQRTIYNGFRNAFSDMGHEFRPLTADQDMRDVLDSYMPDIFISASFSWYRKYIDYKELKRRRDAGMFTLVKIDTWRSPMSKLRINEAPSLKDDKTAVRLIKNGLMGDAYFHVLEQDDLRMDGFQKTTGQEYHTIPLAADRIVLQSAPDQRFYSDISYIGTNLPDKRAFFKKYVFPLAKQYDLKVYGQDWTKVDRYMGWLQRAGQYFNISGLRALRRPKLQLEDEAKIYASSTISINVHESYQRQYGGDCNERTFKIPLCQGFQIVDNVACIKKYFREDKEIMVSGSEQDWLDKIHYYLKDPEKRLPIIFAGRKRVLEEHTYHNRVEYILNLVRKAKGTV